MQCSATQHNTVQYNTIQCNTIFIQHQANTNLLIANNNIHIVVRTTKITVKSSMFTEELSKWICTDAYLHNSGWILWFHIVCPCVHSSVHLSSIHPSIFSFPDNNLSKYEWILTKLSMCIDIVEVWFGFANGQILSVLCYMWGIYSGRVLSFHIFISFSNVRISMMRSYSLLGPLGQSMMRS